MSAKSRGRGGLRRSLFLGPPGHRGRGSAAVHRPSPNVATRTVAGKGLVPDGSGSASRPAPDQAPQPGPTPERRPVVSAQEWHDLLLTRRPGRSTPGCPPPATWAGARQALILSPSTRLRGLACGSGSASRSERGPGSPGRSPARRHQHHERPLPTTTKATTPKTGPAAMPTTTPRISAGTPTKGAAARTALVPGVTGRRYAVASHMLGYIS